jgi:hypothetical protein
MTSFRITPHEVEPGRATVEVLADDGELLAAIYVVEERLIRVISKYIDQRRGGVELDDREPPVVNIRLWRPPR